MQLSSQDHGSIASSQSPYPLKDLLYVIGFFALLTFVIWGNLPDKFTDPLWYSFKYNIARDQVIVQPRPKDCDWGHAPIGDKGCYYKKAIQPMSDDKGKVESVLVEWNRIQE